MGKKLGIIIAIAVLLCVAVMGGAWWWVQQQGGAAKGPQAPHIDMQQASYVTLDKVVVMLKAPEGRSNNYYLSADLVLRSDKAHEKALKAELPMLKSVAVRTLSQMDVVEARAMSMAAWSELLQRELFAAYDEHPDLRWFDQVSISRLIIE